VTSRSERTATYYRFTGEALLALIHPDSVVADIGCGTGNVADLLALLDPPSTETSRDRSSVYGRSCRSCESCHRLLMATLHTAACRCSVLGLRCASFARQRLGTLTGGQLLRLVKVCSIRLSQRLPEVVEPLPGREDPTPEPHMLEPHPITGGCLDAFPAPPPDAVGRRPTGSQLGRLRQRDMLIERRTFRARSVC